MNWNILKWIETSRLQIELPDSRWWTLPWRALLSMAGTCTRLTCPNNQIRDEGLPGIMGPAGTCWDLGCELERLWESSRHLKFSNLFPGNIGNTWKILKRLAITKVSCLRKMICGAGWDNICIRCYSRLYWQTRWAPIIEAMSWSTSWQTNTLVKSVVTQLSLFLKVFGSISKRCAASTAILMVFVQVPWPWRRAWSCWVGPGSPERQRSLRKYSL